ncbi:MAG: dihydropteroate synthase [candidate division NC10 bacterium]|nr:dihydropteroate synthase [candidate division NC10 bacterium]
MGILNVTPDSFSDPGAFLDPSAAAEHALRMVEEGADCLDIGGESTRPGAAPVSAEEEWGRIGPVLERLAGRCPVPLSVDTTKAAVAARALQAGAAIVNDISALRFDPAVAAVVAEAGAGLILMHMQGTPRTMQERPAYGDVVAEVGTFLAERLAAATAAGIPREAILLDPGIGFGKTVEHNLALLRHLPDLTGLGRPLLLGPSRKSFIGSVLETGATDRLEGTAAAVALAIAGGAAILRVHEVKAMARVARMCDAILGRGAPYVGAAERVPAH